MLALIKNLRFWAVVALAVVSAGFIYIDVTGRAEVRASLMIATAPVGRLLYWADEVRKGEAERARLEEKLARENIALGRADGTQGQSDQLKTTSTQHDALLFRIIGRALPA